MLGCILGLAAVTLARRSAWRSTASFGLAFGVAVVGWMLFGPEGFGDRLTDCLFAALLLGPAAIAGVGLGTAVSRLLEGTKRHRALY